MRITTYADADAFLCKARAYLEEDEALNNLLLGIAIRLQDQESVDPPPLFLTGDEGGGLIFAALMTPPRKLILYSQIDDPPFVDLVRYLTQSPWVVPGVLAPADLANPTSNSIYQKIGYRPVADFAEYYLPVPDDQIAV